MVQYAADGYAFMFLDYRGRGEETLPGIHLTPIPILRFSRTKNGLNIT